ncbi:MAG: sulfite reductase subunit beta (hemoprotein) [Odoribacter sp.]|nr:sulfite reductase subunit beta (hemoprotein) [Odoribacter sp.]
MYTLPATLSDDIKYFGSLVDEFLDGKLEPVKFKAIRVPMGIYEQRKDGTFMVRIRCAAGFITPFQLKKVAEIAHRHKSDLLHITTRQEIQMQNVNLSEATYILQNLKEIGLSSKGGGGNTVRNIMVSIDSGIAPDEVFDVTPYAFNLTSRLIAELDSFTLPRKLKIAFSNSEKDTSYSVFNDLGFIAQVKDGKRGFRVYLGGSLATKPMVGYLLFDFVPEEEIFYITDAVKKLFSRYGNRKNKHKARLRYIFYKLGKEEVFRLFFEIYNEIKQFEDIPYQHTTYKFAPPAPRLIPELVSSSEFEKWKERYVADQRQEGLFSVIVPLENGNINAEKLGQLADFTSHFGEDVIRFSMRQNLHFRNIPKQYLGNVYNFLVKIGVEVHLPLLLNTVVACTGADTCRLGICLSKGASAALRKSLGKSDLPLDQLSDLRINISGCPNSCGQQVAADLGFFGKVGRNDRMYPAYHVVAGASIGADSKLAEHVGEVSAFDLPKFTIDIFRLYLEKQTRYPSFSEYVQAEGKADIAELTRKYQVIPEFRDDKNYYFDWGSDQIFSLAAKGVGECSAGLFDMIDVDLNTINETRERLGNETDKDAANKLLYTLVFASSRMLLITRGAEPKNTTEVYNEFLSKFIDAKLISNVYRESVEIVRDDHSYDLSEKKDTILDLSRAVIDLYEGMDDSLQFKNLGNSDQSDTIELPKQITTRKKDFRGVACPMNFVKTKIELATLKSGDLLEILLDEGEPIENVPGSIKGEGHKILDQKKVDDHWVVTIEKV